MVFSHNSSNLINQITLSHFFCCNFHVFVSRRPWKNNSTSRGRLGLSCVIVLAASVSPPSCLPEKRYHDSYHGNATGWHQRRREWSSFSKDSHMHKNRAEWQRKGNNSATSRSKHFSFNDLQSDHKKTHWKVKKKKILQLLSVFCYFYIIIII